MLWLLAAAGIAALFLAWRTPRRLPGRVLVVAHRGASGLAPENTLAALRLAAELGAGWAEVDVQRTSDGVLVLVHDDTWERTTGLGTAVRDTPWATVRELDAGRWFGAGFKRERPPSLPEVLELFGTRLRLNLEIKSPETHAGLGPQVVEAVRRHGLAGRVLLTCFDADLVEELAADGPDLEVGYLAAREPLRRHPAVRTYSLLDRLVLENPALVAEAHARGCRVLVWTVDDARAARRLAELGVDGILTNHPERLVPRLRLRF